MLQLTLGTRCSSVVRVFAHGPIELFLVPASSLLHDWCNKGSGMCYPVCGMMHIKELLLLIGKSSPSGGSRLPLSLSDWYDAYNRTLAANRKE